MNFGMAARRRSRPVKIDKSPKIKWVCETGVLEQRYIPEWVNIPAREYCEQSEYPSSI